MKFLNTKHMIFVLLGFSVVSFKTYPTIFILLGGRDTWIAMILASLLIVLIIDYLLAVCRAENCYDLWQIYRGAVGKPAGAILMGGLVVTIFLNTAESASLGASTINSHFLPHIPIWVFVIATMLCGIYVITRKGTAVVSTTIITILMICLSGITLAILTQRYKNFNLLLPIFGAGVTAKFWLCVMKLVGGYGCVFLIFPFLQGLSDRRHLIRDSNIAMLIMAEIEVFAMIGNITTFDIDKLGTLIYPKLTQSQMISYFAFLEAGELFVMLQVIAGWFIKYILCHYTLLLLADSLHIRFPAMPWLLVALSGVAAALAADRLFRLMRLLDILMYIQLVNYILIPLLVFTVSLCRYRPPASRAAAPQTGGV